MGARLVCLLVFLCGVVRPVGAKERLKKSSPERAERAERAERVVRRREPPPAPDHQGYMIGGAMGAGYAPGGAMVLVSATGAYRWPWEQRYVELHGNFTGGFSGGDIDQIFLAGVRLGTPLGTTGLVGVAGLGYRRVSLAMPFGNAHVFGGASFEGALYMDVAADWRTELGIEMVYPAGGPDGADLVIGFGTHAQVLYRFGDLALYGRYDLLEFHAKYDMGGTSDDLAHAISMGVRTTFW